MMRCAAFAAILATAAAQRPMCDPQCERDQECLNTQQQPGAGPVWECVDRNGTMGMGCANCTQMGMVCDKMRMQCVYPQDGCSPQCEADEECRPVTAAGGVPKFTCVDRNATMGCANCTQMGMVCDKTRMQCVDIQGACDPQCEADEECRPVMTAGGVPEFTCVDRNATTGCAKCIQMGMVCNKITMQCEKDPQPPCGKDCGKDMFCNPQTKQCVGCEETCTAGEVCRPVQKPGEPLKLECRSDTAGCAMLDCEQKGMTCDQATGTCVARSQCNPPCTNNTKCMMDAAGEPKCMAFTAPPKGPCEEANCPANQRCRVLGGQKAVCEDKRELETCATRTTPCPATKVCRDLPFGTLCVPQAEQNKTRITCAMLSCEQGMDCKEMNGAAACIPKPADDGCAATCPQDKKRVKFAGRCLCIPEQAMGGNSTGNDSDSGAGAKGNPCANATCPEDKPRCVPVMGMAQCLPEGPMPNCKSGNQDSWDAYKKAFCCKTARICGSQTAQTCTGPVDLFKTQQRDICCKEKKMGCVGKDAPSKVYSCDLPPTGTAVATWEEPQKLQCCKDYGLGCEGLPKLPYNCTGNADNADNDEDADEKRKDVWSVAKRMWCCAQAGVGCLTPAEEAKKQRRMMCTALWSVSTVSAEACCVEFGLRCPRERFDCFSGSVSDFTSSKLQWCSDNRGVGAKFVCPREQLLAAATADAVKADEQRKWCCAERWICPQAALGEIVRETAEAVGEKLPELTPAKGYRMQMAFDHAEGEEMLATNPKKLVRMVWRTLIAASERLRAAAENLRVLSVTLLHADGSRPAEGDLSRTVTVPAEAHREFIADEADFLAEIADALGGNETDGTASTRRIAQLLQNTDSQGGLEFAWTTGDEEAAGEVVSTFKSEGLATNNGGLTLPVVQQGAAEEISVGTQTAPAGGGEKDDDDDSSALPIALGVVGGVLFLGLVALVVVKKSGSNTEKKMGFQDAMMVEDQEMGRA